MYVRCCHEKRYWTCWTGLHDQQRILTVTYPQYPPVHREAHAEKASILLSWDHRQAVIPFECIFPRKTNGSKSLGRGWIDDMIDSRCWFERSVKGEKMEVATVVIPAHVRVKYSKYTYLTWRAQEMMESLSIFEHCDRQKNDTQTTVRQKEPLKPRFRPR